MSSGVNFDIDDVVTQDTADRLLDARTKQRSVSSHKAVAIEFDPSGIATVLRSVMTSLSTGKRMGIDECHELEDHLKAFVTAYAKLREVEKKAVRDAGQAVEASELGLHVARQLVPTAVGTDRYTGGAKENARERVQSGTATDVDVDILEGRRCAWCEKRLHRSSRLAGSTYCSQECAEDGRLRRGGKYSSVQVRAAIFALEGGKCTLCGMDCHALFDQVCALDPPQRLNKLLSANWRLPKSAKALQNLLQNPKEGDFWQVDHIRAVSEGGGGCGLENLRTLCVPCHHAETERLHSRLRLAGPDRLDTSKRKFQPSITRFLDGCSKKARED
jgi:5-methylcytosine-specific restriction endonuclease McrA